jgi:epoxyqueuosine reductase
MVNRGKEMKDLQEFITQRICSLAEAHSGLTKYRKPVVGFVPATSSRFALLKQVAHADHSLPEDLLPGAQSVVAFFLPFAPETLTVNRKNSAVSREWAVAYIETNALISQICEALQQDLEGRGVKSAFARPTHNFDEIKLVSFWSHKHVAWAAGLGNFGVNQLLITSAGCAGRFGTLVLANNIVDGEPKLAEKGCLKKAGGKCDKCIELCPTQALTSEGLDKARCYSQLKQVDASFSDLPTCDACGKCILGPCALQSF